MVAQLHNVDVLQEPSQLYLCITTLNASIFSLPMFTNYPPSAFPHLKNGINTITLYILQYNP